MNRLICALALASNFAFGEPRDCRADLAAVNDVLARQGFENQGVHFQDGLIVSAFGKGHVNDTVLMIFVFTSKAEDAAKAVKHGYQKIETTCEVDGTTYQPWVKTVVNKNTRT